MEGVIYGGSTQRPDVYDSSLDLEVEWDKLFSWVSVVLPQYTIPELRRTPIHKFYRLVMQAEEKQRKAASANRQQTKAGQISRSVK